MSTTERNSPGVASTGIPLGGFFAPGYIESYGEAWKKLCPATRGLALPIVYLQRHTFELLVKELLKGALEVRSTLHGLDELFGMTESAGPANPDDLVAAYATHSFAELFPPLERNLTALRCSPLPSHFSRVRKLFDGVEEDRPDRLRYETLFSRKKGTVRRSLPTGHGDEKRKYAPCDELASLLEQILEARSQALEALVGESAPPTSELGTFYAMLWESHQVAEREMHSRIAPITGATREGTINWNPVSSECLSIEEHPELKACIGKLLDESLEAMFAGRLMTLVVLKDAEGGFSWRGSGFYLAARRPNGTLTPGVWPDACQSNLVYEIQQAIRRTSEPALQLAGERENMTE